jgi:RNA polymerase sigma factor (sigma-70 family)
MSLNWEDIRNGSREAFLQLYQTYYQVLFNAGCYITTDKELIRDSIHQLFLHLWQTKDTIPVIHHFKSYLVAALRNRILSALREQDKMISYEPDNMPDAMLVEYSYEDIMIRKADEMATSEQLKQAIAQLPPRYRQVIEMKFFQQLSYEAIAQQTGQTVKTTYTYIHEALGTLRKLMKATTSAPRNIPQAPAVLPNC